MTVIVYCGFNIKLADKLDNKFRQQPQFCRPFQNLIFGRGFQLIKMSLNLLPAISRSARFVNNQLFGSRPFSHPSSLF